MAYPVKRDVLSTELILILILNEKLEICSYPHMGSKLGKISTKISTCNPSRVKTTVDMQLYH